jgi:hypothetical protein
MIINNFKLPIPVAARGVGLWPLGSNPARDMDICLLCLYVVLSCVGRGLCDGLITRPEESYCMSMCVIKKPRKGRPKVRPGLQAPVDDDNNNIVFDYHFQQPPSTQWYYSSHWYVT